MHASYGANKSAASTSKALSSSSSTATSSDASKGTKRRQGWPGRGSGDVKLRKESEKLKARFEQSWKGGRGGGGSLGSQNNRILHMMDQGTSIFLLSP